MLDILRNIISYPLMRRRTSAYQGVRKFIGRFSYQSAFTVGIYIFKVNNRNIRTRCEIFSKLTIKTP